jgi:hypothetical protein
MHSNEVNKTAKIAWQRINDITVAIKFLFSSNESGSLIKSNLNLIISDENDGYLAVCKSFSYSNKLS